MEILAYLKVLYRRWPLLVVTVALALGLASASAPRTKIYETSATIVVGPRQLSTDPNRTEFSGDLANGLASLTATYAVLIKSATVAEDAVRNSGVARSPGGVAAATTAMAVPGTQVLVVTVADTDPVVAQTLATGMATAFVNRVTSFRPNTQSTIGSAPAVPVYVYQPAGLPVAPRPLSSRSRVATAGVFGLMAAIGAVLLIEYLDFSVRTVADAERRLGMPVLGALPRVAAPRGHQHERRAGG